MMVAGVMAVDHASALPLHVQVEGVIRGLARRREHARGKPLPGEVELANRLGVSRATVRQAMGRLRQEGLIERRRNAGTTVSRKPVVTRLSDWAGFTAEMARQGVMLKNTRVVAKIRAVPAEVGYFFGVPAGRSCLFLERIRSDGEGPLVEFRSWFHPRLKLDEAADFSRPLYELIEATSGVVVARSCETIGAMTADAGLAKELGCAVGDAILTRQRKVSDVGNKPVEWCDCFYRADRFWYAIDLIRDQTQRSGR